MFVMLLLEGKSELTLKRNVFLNFGQGKTIRNTLEI